MGNQMATENRPKLPISLNMVIRNEESVLARALESVRDIVDEMIILHDGPVEDRSREIAESFGAQFAVCEPWIGVAEPWRIEALKCSRNDWILRLDADEYFLPGQRKLFEEVLAANPDFVYVQFGFLDASGIPVFGSDHDPGMAVLYKKSRVGLVGSVNESVQPLPGAKEYHSSIRLVHDPTKYGSVENLHADFALWQSKTQRWIELQAENIVDWDNQPRWNYPQPRYEFRNNDMAARWSFNLLFLTIPKIWLGALTNWIRRPKLVDLQFARNLTWYYWRVFRRVRKLQRAAKVK
jgi:glycosyltransferase involved in cell wall biosynthesis